MLAIHSVISLLKENTFITAQCSVGVSILIKGQKAEQGGEGVGGHDPVGDHVIGDVDHMSSGRSCDRGCRSHEQWEIM